MALIRKRESERPSLVCIGRDMTRNGRATPDARRNSPAGWERHFVHSETFDAVPHHVDATSVGGVELKDPLLIGRPQEVTGQGVYAGGFWNRERRNW